MRPLGVTSSIPTFASKGTPEGKEKQIQIQEAQGGPKQGEPNRPTPSYTKIKMAKVKERNLMVARERERGKKRVLYKGIPIRLSADFSSESLQARGSDMMYFPFRENPQPRILYPAILTLRIEGDIKNFSDKQKLKELSNTKSTLKEMLR